MSKSCQSVCKVVHALVLIGAFNWGLIGLGYFSGNPINVVNMLLGGWPAVENIVYILVGLSAIFSAVNASKCSKGSC